MSQIAALDDLTLADGELFHDHKGTACPMPAPLAPLADTHGHLTSFRELDPAVTLVRAALHVVTAASDAVPIATATGTLQSRRTKKIKTRTTATSVIFSPPFSALPVSAHGVQTPE